MGSSEIIKSMQMKIMVSRSAIRIRIIYSKITMFMKMRIMAYSSAMKMNRTAVTVILSGII